MEFDVAVVNVMDIDCHSHHSFLIGVSVNKIYVNSKDEIHDFINLINFIDWDNGLLNVIPVHLCEIHSAVDFLTHSDFLVTLHNVNSSNRNNNIVIKDRNEVRIILMGFDIYIDFIGTFELYNLFVTDLVFYYKVRNNYIFVDN